MSDLYLHYRDEDLITPHYWSCSVPIILTKKSLLCRLNDFVIFKNTPLRLKYAIWLVEIMTYANIYAKTKFIQSSLEYDQ